MQPENTEKENEMVQVVSDLAFQVKVAERCAKSKNLIYQGMKSQFDAKEEALISRPN